MRVPTPVEEASWLKAQARRLGESLAEIQARLDALEAAKRDPEPKQG